jgi:hypothetical protein
MTLFNWSSELLDKIDQSEPKREVRTLPIPTRTWELRMGYDVILKWNYPSSMSHSAGARTGYTYSSGRLG